MADLKTQIEVGMNVDGVVTGTDKAKRKISELGGAARDAGTEAGKGLASIGNGGEASAKKVEASTRNTISSIQRQIAAFEAGDKSSRQYQESLARMRGVDVNAIKPYLDQLDAAKAQAGTAATANASLASSFGGIQIAIMAATTVVGGFALGLKKIIDGVDALNDLKDATGASIENISALEDVAKRTGGSFETVSTSLVKFNSVLKDAKPGSDADQVLRALNLSAKELRELDPAEALLKTATAFSNVADDGNKARAMQELFGKSTKDVAAFLKDLAEKGELVATVTTRQADEAEKFNKELFNLGKNAQDVGRYFAADLVTGINAAAKAYRESGFINGIKTLFTGDAEHQSNVAIVEQTERMLFLEKSIASFRAQGYAENSRVIEQAKKQLDEVNQAIKATQALRGEMAGAVAAAADLPKPILKVPEKVDPAIAAAAKRALAEQNKELAEQAKLLAELAGLSGSFSEDWKHLAASYKSGKLSLDGLTKAQADLLAKQPIAKAGHDAAAKAMKAEEKAADELNKTMADYAKASADGVATSIAAAVQAEDALTQYGMLKSAVQELTLEHLEQSRESAALAGEDVSNIEKRIAAQRRLIAATRGIEARDIAEAASKEATAAWTKTAESINSTLTDALMRGFESGKDFAKNMRDTVVNMFKTMVLRPIISAIVNPIAQGVTGMMGLSSGANAANALQTGGSLASIGSTIGSFMAPVTSAMSTFGTAALASTQSLIGLTGTAAQASTAVANGLAYGATGSGSAMASMGAAVPYVAAAIAVAAAVGLFRQTKTVGAGISGTFGGESPNMQNYTAKRKGGYLFGGPKYWDEFSAMDAAMSQNLTRAFGAVKASASSAALALGLSADSVTSYSKSFRLALTGDQAKDQAAIEGMFSGISEDLARTLIGSYQDVSTTVREEVAGSYGAGGWDGGDYTPAHTVERTVTTSTYIPSEFAKEGETAAQTLQRLAVSISAVNSTFDVLGHDLLAVGLSGANTASQLIDAFGGLEAFAATTTGYYQNFYTEAERTARLTEVTSAAFASLGIVMPEMNEGARAWYRSEVERLGAMDMSIEANRTAYAGILSLNGAVNQLAPAFEDAATAAHQAAANASAFAASLSSAQDDAYGALLDANRAIYDAQDEAAQSQQQAAEAATAAADAIRDAMGQAGQSIAEFIAGVRSAIPGQAKVNYQSDLLLAQNGSVEASARLPASARAYLDQQIAGSSTAVEAARARARMAAELDQLPAVKTYQQQMLEAVQATTTAAGGTTAAVRDLHGKFMAELTLSARSEIVKLIDVIVEDDQMTPETKALALLATGSVSRIIGLSATSLLRPQDQALALMTNNTIIKTIDTALGENDPIALGIAFAQSSTIERIIKASGGLLNEDQSKLLDAIGVYNKTVNIDVVVSSDSLTAFQQLLMTTFGTVSISEIGDTAGLGGLNLADLVGQGAIDRLNSIATYINTLDWSGANANASAWATYDAAKAYGVTQADIANATGYNLADIQALFDGASIPRFAVGTNYVPRDMLAQIHEGEAIVPKAYNPAANSQARDEAVVAELRALRADNENMRAELRAIAGHTAKTSRLLDRAMPDGDALATRVAV